MKARAFQAQSLGLWRIAFSTVDPASRREQHLQALESMQTAVALDGTNADLHFHLALQLAEIREVRPWLFQSHASV